MPARDRLDGRSIAPLLLHPKTKWPNPAVVSLRGDHAVRSKHWHYIRYSAGDEELYDATKDPNQWKNLANDTRYTDIKNELKKWLPKNKRVLGVFVPLIESLTKRNWGDNSPPREVDVQNVALFATPSTVASRAFQRELAFRAIGVDVESQACGGLVDAIEDGDLILAEALVRSHVDALKRKMPQPQAAILGCTHYPLMEEIFRDALGKNVAVYSQANLVAESLLDYLDRHPNLSSNNKPKNIFITTGDPAIVSMRASQFLKRSVEFISA